MNILPLILALVLMNSVLTIEKLEKFKNQTIAQKQYQYFFRKNEKQEFNLRQEHLYGESQTSHKQLSFRYLIDEEAKKSYPGLAKQFRLLLHDLIKNVYGEALFFKNVEKTRQNVIDDLFNAIERAAQSAPKDLIKRIDDISRLDLGDPELQKLFYHILKGTVSREEFQELKKTGTAADEKAYISLFNFINYDGKTGNAKIVVQRSPREILKTIFLKDEIVESIILKRNELAELDNIRGSENLFKDEFVNKRRTGLDDALLDFKISLSRKTDYN